MSTTPHQLSLQGVTKRFPGVVALKDVTFEVRTGEVHALVGENGAGKSTLMGVAAGSTVPDTGTVEIGGEPLRAFSPFVSQRQGLAIVRQNPAVVPDLSVLENMLLGVPDEFRAGQGSDSDWAHGVFEGLDIALDLRARVAELNVVQRQHLEIAKALALKPKILILDEPTEPFDEAEIERLLQRVRDLAAAGTAIVYISHRLREVERVADRITVLRDGQVRGTFDKGTVNESDIVRLIVGRDVDTVFPPKRPADAAPAAVPALRLEQFSGARFHDIDLTLQPGEIIGIAGIEGNGQREFVRALAGLDASSGAVELKGRKLRIRNAAFARRAGIAFVPPDRLKESLMTRMTVRENTSMGALKVFSRFGVLNTASESRGTRAAVERLAVKAPSLETPISSLSGGNQQKVVIARQLLTSPHLLVAHEPTHGVDAGARVEIYKILRSVADQGAGVIVASSDGIELAGLCDRVLVFSRGHVVRELAGDDVSEHNITESALTSTQLRRRSDTTEGFAQKLMRLARGDYAPSAVVLLLILLLGVYAATTSAYYMNNFNLEGLFELAAALAFISMGQLLVLLTGGIDMSVGPLAGLTTVIASFFILPGRSPWFMALGFVIIIGVGIAVGTTNVLLVRRAKITPVVATLVTYFGLQGISLLLRPLQGGSFSTEVTAAIRKSIGHVMPVSFLVAITLACLLELGLRRRRWGYNVRATGSDEPAAHRLGVKINPTYLFAYVGCSLLTLLGGILLMGQIGIGDPSSGVTYTLSSITAVVLGGASVYGGRGSFIGALFGALLIQQIINVTTIKNLNQAWQYWVLGLLILAAAGFYSKARQLAESRVG